MRSVAHTWCSKASASGDLVTARLYAGGRTDRSRPIWIDLRTGSAPAPSSVVGVHGT
jgi:hypothetical protein